MIETLSIKNIALIDNLEIGFNNGLNVLTGETGAGKSILIDSIGLLLGNRADKTLIRNGTTECKVVGKFNLDGFTKKLFQSFCEKYDLEYDDEIIISRYFNLDGKNNIRINGQMATLSILKELSSILADCYGQYENQKIFDVFNHLEILDNYSKVYEQDSYKNYIKLYAELKDINNKLNNFCGSEEERLRNIDLLKYQIEEIEKAEISQEEFEQLEDKRRKLMNIGKIISNTVSVENMLNQDCIYSISKSASSLLQASGYDSNLHSLVDRLNSVKIELDDILNEITDYNQQSNYSEEEQQQIELRIAQYNTLLRKYGRTVDEVLENLNNMRNQLNLLQNAKEEIEKLNVLKNNTLKALYQEAEKISGYRKANAKLLCENILRNLQNLGMPNAQLLFNFYDIECNEKYLTATGFDYVELLFSANLGEPAKPLAKIASGGEISRFMLALKAVIANCDNMPTMIFDEIDAGISGKMSEAVAKQMAVISKKHQVIVITHSQQVASMADYNYLIYKLECDGKTNTYVKLLSADEKIKEVARFLSGEKLTDSAMLNAKELIEEQIKYKKSI